MALIKIEDSKTSIPPVFSVRVGKTTTIYKTTSFSKIYK